MTNNIFAYFERQSKATVLAICSSHRIPVDRYIGTTEELKDAIMRHFGQGKCFIQNQDHSFLPEGCESTKQELTEPPCATTSTKSDHSQNELLISWLSKQGTALSRLPLQRLLCVLDVEYDPIDNLRVLRSYLKKYIRTLKKQIKNLSQEQLPDKDKNAIEAKLDNIRARWPISVPQSLKEKIIQMF